MRTKTTVLVEKVDGGVFDLRAKDGGGVFDLYSNDPNLPDTIDWKKPPPGVAVMHVKSGEEEECGCCDHYHRSNFFGDCRDDDARFVRVN